MDREAERELNFMSFERKSIHNKRMDSRSLPFKGRAGVGMGKKSDDSVVAMQSMQPHPPSNLPLEGEGVEDAALRLY